jgi:hypothetical protein
MSHDQPDEAYVVYPLFARHGFKWQAVEQPFAFPVATIAAIEKAEQTGRLKISRSPEPELILKRDRDQTALYFEAKKSSFSSNSSTCGQARGHLLATGPVFADVLTPVKSATLTYVLPADQGTQMGVCLGELTAQLQQSGLSPGTFSVAGLAVENETLVYRLDATGQTAVGCADERVGLMRDLAETTDPGPLMLIFSDQDCADQNRPGYYRHILQQQVLAAMLCRLHQSPVTDPIVISAADLLRETTQGVFDYLGRERQKAMEVLVRENVFRTVSDTWKDRASGMVSLKGRELTVNFTDPAKRDEFFNWLESRKTKFPDAPPSVDAMEQLELFGEQ